MRIWAATQSLCLQNIAYCKTLGELGMPACCPLLEGFGVEVVLPPQKSFFEAKIKCLLHLWHYFV